MVNRRKIVGSGSANIFHKAIIWLGKYSTSHHQMVDQLIILINLTGE